MSEKIAVIGGGIIGLCSAYFLQKDGHEVVVIDKSDMTSGASFVNAGFISPSHLVPLAAPGVMLQGFKWMFNPKSPLFIKPRLDPDFLKWTWAFNKSCITENVQKAIKPIKEIAVLSQELFDDIEKAEKFPFGYQKKGLLMLCQTEKMLEKEIKLVKLAKEQGLSASEVTVNEIQELQPNLTMNIIGGVHFTCDYHSTPHLFMQEMVKTLKEKGVQFFTNEEVIDFEISNQKILSVTTNKQQIKASNFVIASGSWSPILTKKLGIKLLLQAGKGYRIDSFRDHKISTPSLLVEAKVAVTPMNGFTRFAGTMEIAGINQKINSTRVTAIADAVTRYFPEVKATTEEKLAVKSGLRPVSADGLPYIGKSKKCNNLIIATGHAMMGWSMGPGTGKLVSEIIGDKKPSMDINPFHPDRKF